MMRALFEKSREVDVRLLLSKLGFAVSVPIAGYLAVNPNLPGSSSSAASSEAGGVGQSTVFSGASRIFKDELHIRESEGVLAKIMRGTSDITNTTRAIGAIQRTSPSIIKSWVEEGCHLPPVEQLPVYPESIIKQPTYTESEAEKVEMEQETAEIQEQKRSHSLDCCVSNNQQDLMREIEEQLKNNLMKANNLYIKFHSQNEENHHLVIWNPECWGMIREFETVIMVVACLIRALQSDWWHLSHKMAALEPKRITMMANKTEDKQQGDAKIKDSSKMLEMETEKGNLTKLNMSTEVELVDKLEVAENLASSSCSPNDQESEEDMVMSYLIEANQEEMEIVRLLGDHIAEFTNMVQAWQINTLFESEQWDSATSSKKSAKISPIESLSTGAEKKPEQTAILPADSDIDQNKYLNDVDTENCNPPKTSNMLKREQRSSATSFEKVAGSCPSEDLGAETEEKHEVVIQYGSFGIDQKDKNLNDCHLSDCSSQRVINKYPNSSPSVSSMMSNSSTGRSKHHKSFGSKVLGKLKMVLRKHTRKKAKNFPDNTSDTKAAVSSCCSGDMRRNSCNSDLSCSEKHPSTQELFKIKYKTDRWKSDTAWSESCFRSTFEIPREKISAIQEEDTNAF
ncbi:uncharacterized protein LOC122012008 isoform X1 [Zingiber officinale]|uniref:Uncharacterized protein n=1 Tax=Zingiber officinale TaxID=94328 RepID=A0A8J5KLQ2_ZINOF|nr:uncharacterized protein LOC122012008 isoform X1 [Zingiber officinale]KAG6484596.1 hypothetical protein ZIOFF_053117 [Zingiber officinale]